MRPPCPGLPIGGDVKCYGTVSCGTDDAPYVSHPERRLRLLRAFERLCSIRHAGLVSACLLSACRAVWKPLLFRCMQVCLEPALYLQS